MSNRMTAIARCSRSISAAFAALLLALPEIAAAQGTAPAPPVRVRAEIVKLEGTVLHLKDRQGAAVSVKLADNFAVSSLSKADIGDIKPGTYVGTAAIPQSDGSLKAIEVLIFPDAMRGTGEGHRPWDLTPESTMTNATVDSSVSQVNGRTLTLKYKDGSKTIVVPPEAPIVAMGPGSADMLKPGSHVFIIANKQPDGSLAAARVTVGKDGLVPPM